MDSKARMMENFEQWLAKEIASKPGNLEEAYFNSASGAFLREVNHIVVEMKGGANSYYEEGSQYQGGEHKPAKRILYADYEDATSLS